MLVQGCSAATVPVGPWEELLLSVADVDPDASEAELDAALADEAPAPLDATSEADEAPAPLDAASEADEAPAPLEARDEADELGALELADDAARELDVSSLADEPARALDEFSTAPPLDDVEEKETPGFVSSVRAGGSSTAFLSHAPAYPAANAMVRSAVRDC